jgi:hypothetical protein
VAAPAFERLLKVLPPPVRPVETPPTGQWDAIEGRLGAVLPLDYKAFVELFGSGFIDRFLWVFNPFSADENIRLAEASERQLAILRWLREQANERVPYPIFPEPDGLLPWGETANGDCFYWITSHSSPDEWSVVVNEARAPNWHEHAGPMTAFLADLLDGSTSVDFFPATFPSAHPSFERF